VRLRLTWGTSRSRTLKVGELLMATCHVQMRPEAFRFSSFKPYFAEFVEIELFDLSLGQIEADLGDLEVEDPKGWRTFEGNLPRTNETRGFQIFKFQAIFRRIR